MNKVSRSVSVLMVVILGGGVAAGWIMLRSTRARREAIAQREMVAAPQAGAGEDALAAQALANYLATIRAQVRDHEAAFLRLQERKALSWNIHERTDIERDREIIRDFLATNTRLTDTLKNGDGFIRAELDTAKVPAAVRESALALYAKTEGPLLPLQMHVRHCDQMIGDNALAVLDLLDFDWGAWHRDDATGRIEFSDSIAIGALVSFKDHVAKIAAAANERKDAEDELAKAQQRRAPP